MKRLFVLVALVSTGFLPSARRASAADLPPDLNLVPRDAAGFYHFHVADTYKAEWMADVRHLADKAGPEALKDLEKKYGPELANVERVTAVFLTPHDFNNPTNYGTPTGESAVLIVRTSKPFDRLRLMKRLGLREKVYKRHLYYFDETQWTGMLLVDNQTFLIAAEDSLLHYIDQTRNQRKDNSLQAALETAAGQHQFTVGLNPQFLGKEEGAANLPPSLSKLLEARCITMTVDLEKDLKYAVRIDFEKNEEATAGSKALRDFLEMSREFLKQGITEAEQALKKKEENSAEEVPQNLAVLLGLGILREIDTLLKDAPIQTKGTAVTMDLNYKGGQSTSVGLFALFGVFISESRSSFVGGTKIKPAGGADPHEQHLKAIAEALDRYHADKGSYPPPAILDKEGRPILSWRVALLPYLGEEAKALYKEFNLEEPWDGLNNKKLIEKMPLEFRMPDSSEAYKTATHVFSGEDSIFTPKGRKKADLKPGAALLALGTSEAATYWSKPLDFALAEGKPLPSFWNPEGQGKLYVFFADGTVRPFTKDTAKETILREIARPAGAKLDALPAPLPRVAQKETEKETDK